MLRRAERVECLSYSLERELLGETVENTSAEGGAGQTVKNTSAEGGAGQTVKSTSAEWGAGRCSYPLTY